MGRPRAYQSEKELKGVTDGCVLFGGGKLQNRDFQTEKQLGEFITANIRRFSKSLGGTYVSHTVDTPITRQTSMSPRGRRVDLLIECADKTLVVELKNPSSGTECRAAIGQILDYGREFPDTEKKELVIVSTRFDINAARTIKHYNLPIRYVYVSRERTMEFQDECENRQAA